MNRLSGRLSVLPAVCAAACAACTGSLFHSSAAPPTTYMLSAGMASPSEVPEKPAAAIPVDLSVRNPTARSGLESDRIAVLYPDRRLDYFAGARWSGPLAEVLRDFAVQEFHSHAGLRTVSGDASVFASSYWLEIEITDFQAEYTPPATVPSVHVRLLARLGSSADRHIVGRFEADARRPAAEERLSSIVDAFARAADASLAEIVAQARQALAQASQAR